MGSERTIMCFTACMEGKGREHVTCLVAQAPNCVTFEIVAILRGRKVYFVSKPAENISIMLNILPNI